MMEALTSTVSADKQRLRLWIRLLRVARVIEGELRDRLKTQFEMTLPRFDVMSALYRERDGMLMSDLSRFLLVSNGNVTGIVDRLVAEGLVSRSNREGDRRTSIARLTRAGEERFALMAEAHRSWVEELLHDISEEDARVLSSMLKAFRSNWESEH